MKLHFVRILRSAFFKVCFSISLVSPCLTFGGELSQPHGAITAQLGGPSYQASTDWQGFNVIGISVQVNLGGDIGGTAANVTMSGSGNLQFSQYPGSGSVSFNSSAGTATMDIGFQTWAKYRIAFAGFQHEGDLPLLPDIANTDLSFNDQQSFNSYMLGSTVTLSDTVDDVQIVSVPAVDSAEFELPPGLFDISIGISVTPSLTCNLRGVRLDTSVGTFYAPGDTLNVNLNAPSLAVSGIVQTTHCDFTAGISPNGTVEVSAFGLWDHTGTLPTGLTIPIPLGSTDISTTPSQSVTFNLQSSGISTAPVITTVSPSIMTGLPSPQTQLIRIIGSGFTSSSTLLFNGSITSDPARLVFVSANELDYSIVTGTGQLNWTVQVVNGSQTSDLGYFTVNAPTASPTTTGSLVVNLTPSGIGGQWQVDNTGYNSSGQVVGYLTPGSHTVSFKPVSGYTTPSSEIVTVNANVQTTANVAYSAIAPSTYTLTLNYNAAQGGASASPVVSENIYTAGQVVSLYANPSSGYHFTGWSGGVSGSANPIQITMNGNETVTANFASGDPNLATVTVTILPSPAATAGVQWGTSYNDYRNSSTSYTTYPGSYFLVLHPVSGWISPIFSDLVPITVTAGETTNVTVTFTQDTTPGLLTVLLSPQGAVSAGAKWHADGGAAQGNGATLSLPAGNHAVTFDSVSGWTAPANQTVTVQRAQTTVVTGNYSPPAGQPVIGGVSPAIGAMTGGNVLTISGVNFTAPATVFVGGQPATNVSVSSSTQITCLVPPNSVYGTAAVVVQTAGGSATNLNGFAYGMANGNGITLVSSVGGYNYAVAVSNTYAYVGEGRDFVVLNISTPSSPLQIGRVTLPGIVKGIALFAQYAYVADQEGGLQVVDLSNPSAPAIRGFYPSTGYTEGIAILGGRAYVADRGAGLEILDLGIPTLPSLLSSTNCGGGENVLVKASGNGVFAYLTTGVTLCVVDVSNPGSPALLSQTSMGYSGFNSIAMTGNYVFTGSASSSSSGLFLHMIDVSNPNAPVDSKPSAASGFQVSAVAVANNDLYAVSPDSSIGLVVFNISGSTLTYAGQSATIYAGGDSMVVSGNQLCVAGGSANLKIADVTTPNSPVLQGQYNDSGLFANYSSCAVTGNSLSVPLGGGLNVFDASQPVQPILAATLNAGGSPVVSGNGVAYCANAAANSGVQIFSVANPTSPQLLASIPNTVISGGKMQLSGNTLYVAGYNPATQQPRFVAIDVSTPSSPNVSCTKDFSEFSSGLGSLATSVAVNGSKVVIGIHSSAGVVQLNVLDISNLGAPVEKGSLDNIGYPNDLRMSADGNYVYEMDVSSNSIVRIVDVSNPSSPFLATNIYLDAGLGQRLGIRGHELYAATSQGVYVFDVINPSSPVLTRTYSIAGINWIDVPSDSISQSGNIYLADSDGGIVILKELDIQAPDVFITNPWSLPTYTNATSSINLGGGSDDNVGVTAMTWANNRGGSGNVSAPFDNWYVSSIPLYPGTNILEVTAFDAAGNSGNDTLTVIYQSTNEDQTIAFPAIADCTFGDAPLPLVASASSGVPVTFNVVSGPATVTSSNTLILAGAGAVTVEADQSGNASFNPAVPVDISFNIARANQSILFAPVPNHAASDPPFALTATASSGLPVYFDILSGPAAVDTNGVVTLLGAGMVTAIASQPGDSNYNPAITVPNSFNVSPIPQTITFGALSQQKVGDAPFALNATASSGLQVGFSVSGPALLSGNIVTLTGWGTVTFTALQSGNNTYAAAAPVAQSLFVAPTDNTLVSMGFLTNGGFQMAFYGTVGTNYTLQASADLANWSPLFNFTCTNSPTILADTNAISIGQNFYRLKQ